MMTALEALERLQILDDRIAALTVAYDVLWDDFDKRLSAIALQQIKAETETERSLLADKLRAVNL
jgi:hypothetical protein